MPTYEYACRDCGHTFEIVQSMKDDALAVCPVCGGTLRKVFAPPAIAFKGSGFYATDHRKKTKHADDKGDAAEKKAPAKAETQGDTKSGTKGDGKSGASSGSSGSSSSGGSKDGSGS